MNTETKVWLTLIGAVAVASFAFYASRLTDRDRGEDASTANAPAKGESNAAAADRQQRDAPEPESAWPPEPLGPAPEFQLTDQSGRDFGTQQLKGKVWIANFVFTRCRGTCPEQTRQFAQLQQACLDNPNWAGVKLVSVSVDPEHDQPAVLQAYAEDVGAKPGWHFLTGPRETIWSMSKDGFHLPVNADAENAKMPIMHDSKFVLVDRSGMIRGYYDLFTAAGRKALGRALDYVTPEIKREGDVTHLAMPPENLDIDWFDDRRQTQATALAETSLAADFEFQNRLAESGIDYDPQIVDEQRWRLKVNHYDHGTGVATADVDGDDRLDLYFVSQAGGNALYRNLGEGKFENITAQAQVALADRVGVAAAFADVDNDGDADLFVTTVRGGNVLFRNDGSGVFSDVSEEAGVAYRGHSSGAVFFDYDRDGWLDLFVTNVGKYTTDEQADLRLDDVSKLKETQPYYLGTGDSFAGHLKPELTEASILYRNRGDGTFKDVTEATGLVDENWSGAATPLDVNEDGWLDLYVLNMQGNDAYWENQQGKRFEEKTAQYFPATPWGAMGVKSLDFDNDGRFDLYITDMHSDMSEDVGPELEKQKSNMQWDAAFLATREGESIFGNAFYHKQADGSFREVSDAIGAENYWPWGLSSGDLNADGFEDVFIASSMCFPYRYSANSLLLNQQGQRWVDAEFALGVEPRAPSKRMQPWFVLDADGRDQENQIAGDRQGKLVIWSALGSRSSVVLDLDDDGDLDVVTNDFNSPPLVLMSDLSKRMPKQRWLKVRLTGDDSNRDGLGAVVTVTSGGLQVHRSLDGQSGYLAQSRAPLYFGLGDASTVDRVEITWLGGQRQTLEGPIETNQRLDVQQAKTEKQ